MRLLPKPRRQAMFALYAFCREVDDIGDGDLPEPIKREQLDAWRAEIARLYAQTPTTAIGQALLGPIKAYGLEREDFLAVIDGVAMDATGAMLAPTMAELKLYCQRVAGAVGRLSVKIFGAEDRLGKTLAAHLGEALQLTNVLRDLVADAEAGRLYLPRELLAKHGITARDPRAVLRDPRIAGVLADLAEMAREMYREAEQLVANGPRRALRPAAVMMAVYRRLLERLIARGWKRLDQPVELAPFEKLWIALRHGLM
jgi:phytoene synthase